MARATWIAPEMSAAAPERMILSALALASSVSRMVVAFVSVMAGGVGSCRRARAGGPRCSRACGRRATPDRSSWTSPRSSPSARSLDYLQLTRGVKADLPVVPADPDGLSDCATRLGLSGDDPCSGAVLAPDHCPCLHVLCIPERHTEVKQVIHNRHLERAFLS